MKATLWLYRLYASLRALASYARGEASLQPNYQEVKGKRVRRSLSNPGEAIVHGWKEIEQGRYANSVMLYAATIGEFRSLMPVIDVLLEHLPGTPLVIISGQAQYLNTLYTMYPQAALGTLPPSAPWLYDRLFKLVSPRAVLLGEGPCLFSHFPIVFDLALPAVCLRHSTPMAVLNATMYARQNFSASNRLEARFFGKIHTQAIAYWYAANDIFKSWLLKEGVPADRIVVTGDLRFNSRRALGAVSAELAELLAYFREATGPVIVAGSVNAIDEEGPVIDGWLAVREKHAGARLIIAPRHVNNRVNMGKLYDYLVAKGVQFAKRSDGVEAVKKAEVIVVDVFGELIHYYSIAALAYIGRNHTLFEPLRFEVPTVVAPRADWAAGFVSYPAYLHMIDEGGVIEAQDKQDLGGIFSKIVDEPDYGRGFVLRALRVAETERGAAEQIASHLLTYLRGQE